MENKEIIIYKTENNEIELRVQLEKETIWLTQRQMSDLFHKDSDTIGLHIQNIYETAELNENTTTEEYSVVQKEGNRNVKRKIKHYNLDVIISVGYRVNSKQGTQFRIWATNVLRKYVVEGYAINQKRLVQNTVKYIELQDQIKILRKVIENETITLEQSKDLIRIISDYTSALELIDQMDHENIVLPTNLHISEGYKLNYDLAISEINNLRHELEAHELFGNEKDDGFKSAIKSIHQTFDGSNLYKSLEEKAANLLYLIIKNHPFTDGNKRIGAFMFIRFLDLNGLLYRSDGTKLIEENTLVAIALLIAQSDTKQKDLMVRLMVNLLV